MGIYDLPAVINFILNESCDNYSKILFIGHSLGCTSILAGLCEREEYFKERLNGIIFLAPACKLNSTDSLFSEFLSYGDENKIGEFMPFGKNEFNHSNFFLRLLKNVLFDIISDDESLLNCSDRVNIYFSHFPSGSSYRCIRHLKQIYESKQFQYYDYNDDDVNYIKYNDKKPKLYNLKNITNFNFIICTGKNDRITTPDDTKWLCDELSQNNKVTYYEFDMMCHLSFILSSNILWFNNIMEEINNITK